MISKTAYFIRAPDPWSSPDMPYEIAVAESVMAEPVWPELSFQELVRIAYRDRMVTSLDHAVVKRLRGLA